MKEFNITERENAYCKGWNEIFELSSITEFEILGGSH